MNLVDNYNKAFVLFMVTELQQAFRKHTENDTICSFSEKYHISMSSVYSILNGLILTQPKLVMHCYKLLKEYV